MFKQIDSNTLALVSGGKKSNCPQYVSDSDVLSRRQHMTKSQRAAEDRAWKKTVAHLSPDRLQAVRHQAELNGARQGCAAPDVLPAVQMDEIKW
jgi:hypothetical protein